MLGATFTRIEAEIVGVLLLVAFACLGAGFWLHQHDDGVARAATAPILAAADAASAAQATKAANTDAQQAENLHEFTIQNAAHATDARDLAAAVADAGRMRDDAIRRGAAASPARSAGGSDPASDPTAGLVPWGMYAGALSARAEAESDAADLAGVVRGLLGSGALCVSDYRAAQ